MKVYLDGLLLLNFGIDFLLLYGTSRILKERVKMKRLILGSIVGSLSILLLFIELNSLELFIVKVGVSALIILSSFGRKGFIKNFLYFYLLGIILGGGLSLLNNSFVYQNKGIVFFNNGLSINLFLSMIVGPLIIMGFVKENREYKNTYGNIYDVSIYMEGKMIKVSGMIDTGNMLVDPYSGKSVILVNKDIVVKGKKIVYVPYRALNTAGVIKCFVPDKVLVGEKQFNNCLVGVSKKELGIGGVSCILPNKFKEDL